MIREGRGHLQHLESVETHETGSCPYQDEAVGKVILLCPYDHLDMSRMALMMTAQIFLLSTLSMAAMVALSQDDVRTTKPPDRNITGPPVRLPGHRQLVGPDTTLSSPPSSSVTCLLASVEQCSDSSSKTVT